MQINLIVSNSVNLVSQLKKKRALCTYIKFVNGQGEEEAEERKEEKTEGSDEIEGLDGPSQIFKFSILSLKHFLKTGVCMHVCIYLFFSAHFEKRVNRTQAIASVCSVPRPLLIVLPSLLLNPPSYSGIVAAWQGQFCLKGLNRMLISSYFFLFVFSPSVFLCLSVCLPDYNTPMSVYHCEWTHDSPGLGRVVAECVCMFGTQRETGLE